MEIKHAKVVMANRPDLSLLISSRLSQHYRGGGERDMAEKYLEFKIAHRAFACPISQVKEIIEYPMVEPLPLAPQSLLGTMNLRGRLAPVLELAAILNMESQPIGKRTCVVVTQSENHEPHQLIGMKVDQVSRVVDIEGKDIETISDLGSAAALVMGVAKLPQQMLTVLDVSKVLSSHHAQELLNHQISSEVIHE
ncbi:purine-binding chemotaxis protein CheW [Vibrio vulnificus]|nr:purine-binding chemotaxis protein CheW [Vibrio vulnificus]EGR0232341.1 purine-binding chemotaxis protein CheW [Vibrio vulnificus]RZQ18079.1 purine-binding chemotaxis protein CheW [Vibrio vulnificus]HAS8489572.1 purine-binding chemotaxis protein CheW [Vibrio vulnificus]